MFQREFVNRQFLAKQRMLCQGKSYHQFEKRPALSVKLVKEFFGDCHELSMCIDGNIVRLSMKKPAYS